MGDFRRGSVSENYRKCGKPNCVCAVADHPGHGPRFLWTRSAGRRKTVGRQLAAAEVDKVRRELARHAEFTAISEQIAEVNEKICEARPVAGTAAPPVPGSERGLWDALREEASAEIGRLAAEAARSLGCDAGLEAAETVIRAGMLQLGGGMLEKLAGIRLAVKRVERAAEASGAAAAQAARDRAAAITARALVPLPPSPLPDKLYGAIDGAGVPIDREGDRRAGRQGRGRPGPHPAPGYFENNVPRMRYHWFRSHGLFVGSGAVESGCKAVIGQRLKLSGMHWTLNGASAIATLRCRQARCPDDQIWHAVRNQTGAA